METHRIRQVLGEDLVAFGFREKKNTSFTSGISPKPLVTLVFHDMFTIVLTCLDSFLMLLSGLDSLSPHRKIPWAHRSGWGEV